MEDGGREEEVAGEWERWNEERKKKEEGMKDEGWKKEGR